jgi:hypothetical protein
MAIPPRLVNFAAPLVAAALCACTNVRLDFQELPPAEALRSIQPGVTTRTQVLERLGPPEEVRRPTTLERARVTMVQSRGVLEAGDVFGRGAFTYASGHRSIDVFGILPIAVSVFRVTWSHSTEERWRIEFDEAEVVRSVSHVDENDDEAR